MADLAYVDMVVVTVTTLDGSKIVGEICFADRDGVYLDTGTGWTAIHIPGELIARVALGTSGGDVDPGAYQPIRAVIDIG